MSCVGNIRKMMFVLFFIGLIQIVSAEIVYQQNFDSLTVGTFPDGYEQYYSGRGWQYAVIDNSQSYSSPNSFKMEGAESWSQEIGVKIPPPPQGKIWFEAKVRTAEAPSQFTNHRSGIAVVGFYKPSPRHNYGAVQFVYDPNSHEYYILGGNSQIKYSPNTWYTVKILTDLSSHKFTAWINGIPLVTDFPVDSVETPNILLINADNGGSYTKVWYDDINIGYETTTPTQIIPTLPINPSPTTIPTPKPAYLEKEIYILFISLIIVGLCFGIFEMYQSKFLKKE